MADGIILAPGRKITNDRADFGHSRQGNFEEATPPLSFRTGGTSETLPSKPLGTEGEASSLDGFPNLEPKEAALTREALQSELSQLALTNQKLADEKQKHTELEQAHAKALEAYQANPSTENKTVYHKALADYNNGVETHNQHTQALNTGLSEFSTRLNTFSNNSASSLQSLLNDWNHLNNDERKTLESAEDAAAFLKKRAELKAKLETAFQDGIGAQQLQKALAEKFPDLIQLDLPALSASIQGNQQTRDAIRAPEKYEAPLGELWPNGTQHLEFKQGEIGDCYLLAAINAISDTPQGAEALAKMVTKKPEGGYSVQFHEGAPIDVSVDEIREWQVKGNVDGPLGLQVLEVAYGKYRDGNTPIQDIVGGDSCRATHDLVGWDCQETSRPQPVAEKTSYGWSFKSGNLQPEALSEDPRTKDLLDGFSKQPKGYILTAITPKTNTHVYSKQLPSGQNVDYIDPTYRLPLRHVFTIEATDPQNQTVTLSDPHDSAKPIILTYDEFSQYFDALRCNQMSTAPKQ